MDWLRHGRVLAALLLSFQAVAVAQNLGPRGAVCACSHGADTPCACPIHASASADDSKLPPCHRHRGHAAPKTPASSGPCLTSQCAGLEPALSLVTWLELPEPEAIALQPLASAHAAPVFHAPEPRALQPLRRPPRAAL